MEEYTTTIINTTYQFLLQTHGISAHPTDMGRCVLLSAHLKGKPVNVEMLDSSRIAIFCDFLAIASKQGI
jgi:hypothetical protein